ncbi:hypothetical protein MEO41_28315, partial [Dolichospermum sp. ST_sed4]|nr:hypothetical protein [Dolichospermum sp. ST_sed4]
MLSIGNDNFSLATLDENGNPPATRINNASHCWNIANNLRLANIGRENKRIYLDWCSAPHCTSSWVATT